MESSRSDFSKTKLVAGIALTLVVLVGVYFWNQWMLWNAEPFVDPASQTFIDSRQKIFSWTTPILAGFILMSSFAIWYAIADRRNIESLIGGVCLSFPILIFLGPLSALCVSVPMVTPFFGFWLIWRRRLLLGGIVIVFAVAWLWFAFNYFDGLLTLYGD